MWLWGIIFFILGTAVGSFLNVVILRLGQESIRGRSRCRQCGKTLGFWELIPLVSFFMQQGRCRSCQEKISLQYPIVEFLSGLLFLAVGARFLVWFPIGLQTTFFFSRFGWWLWLLLIFWLFFGSLLLAIAGYDLKHYLIPDALIWPAIAGAVLYAGFGHLLWIGRPPLFPSGGLSFSGESALLLGRSSGSIIFSLLGAFFAVLLIGSVYLFSRGRAMGFGDVEFSLFMGLALGWPDVLVALFLSFILGTLVSLGLILFRKKKLRSLVPFGPFLAAGTMTAMLFGDRILSSYFAIFPRIFI